jgi:hypothetical protein
VKRLDDRLSLPHGPFTGSDEHGGDQRTSQRAQRAIRQSARARAVKGRCASVGGRAEECRSDSRNTRG